MKYLVRWEIDLDADSPREAAKEALDIQRDVFSMATVFKVFHPGGSWEWVDFKNIITRGGG